MRRGDRQITDAEARSMLEAGEYGVLSTVSPDHEAYGIPLNYCVIGDAIYFHCAIDGRKLDNITHDPRVSFCVVGKTEVLPAQFSTRYECCIVQGIATEALGEEKQRALEALVRKYSADFLDDGLVYIRKSGDRTRVFGISIQSMTAKARR